MKKRHKLYLKINLVSLAFIIVSFISVTLAWFAYSGLSNVATEVEVKAWYIELEKDGETVSNDIVISLSEIYPGMNTVNETVNIKNLGDSDAKVNYKIVSARILDNPEDNYIVNDLTTSEFVEDNLSHEYPFHININLEKNYILAKGEENAFEVSVSWPLDSDDDAMDSLWGRNAYAFEMSEQDKKVIDPEYQIRPSIQVVISVTAEQYIEEDIASDPRYNLGDIILFDVVNNTTCTTISSTCLKTYVIDKNNTLGDEAVTLLPDPTITYLSSTYDDYISSLATVTNTWTVNNRPLLVSDILKIIQTDIISSVLVRDGISDLVIGNLNYNNRLNNELTRAISYNGYYQFINERFSFFSPVSCYWTNSEYNLDNGFAINNIDGVNSKLYGEAKTTSCNIIPVIIANKINL